jgi:septal ring factor EnvC (AmiA/AmiB activator)
LSYDGEKGGDGVSGEASSEIDSLSSQLEKVETLLQEQTRESQKLKAQLAGSKSIMKAEIKDQLDDFLTKFMRL